MLLMCPYYNINSPGIWIAQHEGTLMGFIHTFAQHLIKTSAPKIQFTIFTTFYQHFDLQISIYNFTRIYIHCKGFLPEFFKSHFSLGSKNVTFRREGEQLRLTCGDCVWNCRTQQPLGSNLDQPAAGNRKVIRPPVSTSQADTTRGLERSLKCLWPQDFTLLS